MPKKNFNNKPQKFSNQHQGQNSRPNFKTKEKRKPKIETFVKHCPTFEDALIALTGADAIINDILKDVTNIPEAIKRITDDYYNNIPDLVGKEHIYSSLSSSANKLSYKLDEGFAFGWEINYHLVDGKAVIDDVKAIIKVFRGNEDLKKAIEDWEYIM